ncbi:MAG: 50S ribosomal protein L4 [Patescibacteria group bacterium]|jgi:large subunit ribosomal protein L4
MVEVKLYNLEGKEVGVLPLSDVLFAVEPKTSVIHDVVVAQDANSRAIHAHVKDRSEVRGGGKKPWKQKGTGRARHGSSRSPIWIGGGITHGPHKEQNFSVKINKKTRRLAIAMLLTDKLRDSAFVAVENFVLPEGKTKLAAQMRKVLPGAEKSALVLVTPGDDKMIRALKNMPKTKSMYAHSLNARDLAKYGVVVASKAAIETLEHTFVL